MIKILRYFIESIFVYFFFFISKLLGLQMSRKVFSMIFKLFGPFFRSRKTIEKNLNRYSSQLTLSEKNKIISNMWSNYGMTFVEYMYLKKLRIENGHIEVEGKKYLETILQNNKPVIFVSGHFANFELMSMEITKNKNNLATIYRPLNNIFLNFFMEYLRKKFVCPNQIKKGRTGVKSSIEFLKKNYSIALMIDQRVSEGEKINLFGEKAYTTTLPAQLALKFNLDIVPISIIRKNNNFFFMKILDPIKSTHFKDKISITQKLNEKLEELIKENPDQWIWTHNRWK